MRKQEREYRRELSKQAGGNKYLRQMAYHYMGQGEYDAPTSLAPSNWEIEDDEQR